MESLSVSAPIGWWRKLRLSRAWRVPATGIGFALFGLGGAVLSLSVFPILYFLPVKQAQRAVYTRRVIATVFRNYVRVLRWLGLLSYEFHRIEQLHRPGQLIIANHPSLLDVVFLMGLTHASCVVKASLWRNPFTAMAVRAANYVSNSDPDLLNRCVDTFKAGHSLIIFPEGTRTKPGQPMVFHRGPSNLALSAGMAITPVMIRCEPATLLKNQQWYEISAQPPHYTIRVLPDVATAAYMADGQMQSMAARQLTRDLVELFTQQLQQR
ncbi:lysophospholipid acyltransferase family protein [Cellvibrio fibrivorans]|uniref:1-acyl-sn-glycerol-3-phosphate acyltransferase n=1 Tax=Cellvibrio fibrivorans TaxID=126350 RepID=A0ABU1UUE7_9GAMM|nr:lysophospholipid acyltransferase family protein [Cellvibrio fibrivorans]MDR7088794.1 1-acyl-sn-glycerol-3-phosphate acyltransferase [Cellvibrio fibrivorans]